MGNLGNYVGENGFDVNSVDTESNPNDGGPKPAGWYQVGINKATIKDNKKQTGKILSLDFIIIQESYNNAHFFEHLNIVNPNQTAQDIAWRDIAKIGKAVGIENVKDEDELIGKMLDVKVAVKADDNEIKDYKPLNSMTGSQPQQTATPPQTGPSPTQQQPSTPPVNNQQAPAKKLPWEK